MNACRRGAVRLLQWHANLLPILLKGIIIFGVNAVEVEQLNRAKEIAQV
jgi:endonuclease V-like protein UPF0215 family